MRLTHYAAGQVAGAAELLSRELARAGIQHVTLSPGRGTEAATRFNDADPSQRSDACVAVVDLLCVGARPLRTHQGARPPRVALFGADTATFADTDGEPSVQAAAVTAVTANRPLAWGPVRVRRLVAANSIDEGLLRWQRRAVKLVLRPPAEATPTGERYVGPGCGKPPNSALLRAVRCGAGQNAGPAARAEAAAALEGWEAYPSPADAAWSVALVPESFSPEPGSREGGRSSDLGHATATWYRDEWVPNLAIPPTSVLIAAAAAVAGALLRAWRE